MTRFVRRMLANGKRTSERLAGPLGARNFERAILAQLTPPD
jgi:hypothetical protein